MMKDDSNSERVVAQAYRALLGYMMALRALPDKYPDRYLASIRISI
jgi:hypothetical protein